MALSPPLGLNLSLSQEETKSIDRKRDMLGNTTPGEKERKEARLIFYCPLVVLSLKG